MEPGVESSVHQFVPLTGEKRDMLSPAPVPFRTIALPGL